MYGKLFAQMYDGSLYGKWQALVTFQQMIVLADPEGVVDMTPQALAARTSIPLEIIQQGVADLEQPDPDSRTPDEEGRRIVRLSEHRTWGWRITNHAHYREIRSVEERRAYMREYQQTRRQPAPNTVNTVLTDVNTSKPVLAMSTDTEAEAYTVTTSPHGYSDEFKTAWGAYPKRPNNSKAEAWRSWQARLKAGEEPAVMMAGIIAYAAYCAQEGTEPRFVKHAATFLGPDRHYLNDFSPPSTGPPHLGRASREHHDLQDEPDLEWVTAESVSHVRPH